MLGLTALPMGSAGADAAAGTSVPLGITFRACDHVKSPFVHTNAVGSGNATISADSTTVTATVTMAILAPGTTYQVRLIQGPRPSSQRCNAGDPGVASASLIADGNGVGSVTLSGPRIPGATNAWVYVDGPPPPGQIRGDYYTSDILTTLG